jgi:hypothetical protein
MFFTLLCAMDMFGQISSSPPIATPSSKPAADGKGRIWFNIGWQVGLTQGKDGWSCSIQAPQGIELVSVKPRVSYLYGMGFVYGPGDTTKFFVYHQGPQPPTDFSSMDLWGGGTHFITLPIESHYMLGQKLVMTTTIPKGMLLNTILPVLADNGMMNVILPNRVSYHQGAVNLEASGMQFKECLQWMNRYNGSTQ